MKAIDHQSKVLTNDGDTVFVYAMACPGIPVRDPTNAEIKAGICPPEKDLPGVLDSSSDQDLALGFCGFILVLCLLSIVRGRRRRAQRLPPPDDPRLRNVTQLKDWKKRGGQRLHPRSSDVV